MYVIGGGAIGLALTLLPYYCLSPPKDSQLQGRQEEEAGQGDVAICRPLWAGVGRQRGCVRVLWALTGARVRTY